MGNMIEVKTSELVGQALDWAVAQALGYTDGEDMYHNPAWFAGDKYIASKHVFRPSSSWDHCGPIIEKHKVIIAYHEGSELVPMACLPHTLPNFESGRSVLIAVCRAVLAAKYGETVQVPRNIWMGFS